MTKTLTVVDGYVVKESLSVGDTLHGPGGSIEVTTQSVLDSLRAGEIPAKPKAPKAKKAK